MDYPIYKNRYSFLIGKLLLSFIIINVILSIYVPIYIYVGASLIFVVANLYSLSKYRGLKAFSVFITTVLCLLLSFDFVDKELTWSLDYVFPSFLIAIAVIQLAVIIIHRKNWIKSYDIHIYVTILNILMVVLFVFGIIESSVMMIVAYSIVIATVILIRMIVGKSYKENVHRFTHL